MKQFTLDGAAVGSRAQLHALLAEGLALPEYYGRNLDALHDCLTEPMPEETRICIRDLPALQAALGGYAQRFIHVLYHAARENPKLRIEVL